MKMENDGFTPAIRNSLEANIRTLQESETERQRLEQSLYQCRKKGRVPRNKRQEAAELQQRLAVLNQEQGSIVPEAERQIEELKQGRQPFSISDETEQPFNECVGHAYGVAVFVGDNGLLLYCEVQEDAVQIGDTLSVNELFPFENLPTGEQDMILRELARREETPGWFRKQIETA